MWVIQYRYDNDPHARKIEVIIEKEATMLEFVTKLVQKHYVFRVVPIHENVKVT